MNVSRDAYNACMRIAKFTTPSGESSSAPSASDSVGVGIVEGDQIQPLELTDRHPSLSSILHSDSPIETVRQLIDTSRRDPLSTADVTWLPPVDAQEIWAAGVTYKRSQTARMEESEAAASCYDRVYDADRPELFFKSTASRVRGHGQPVRIRDDSRWDVPEPEITLVVSPSMRIVGLTCGNDMSSRSIEGDNPLYLPQAKTYTGSASVGPWIELIDALPSAETVTVELDIRRAGESVFGGETSADQMARGFEDLVGWLGRELEFPDGVFLMTGTGIVPDSNFTLQSGDEIAITIDPVGTLINTVA